MTTRSRLERLERRLPVVPPATGCDVLARASVDSLALMIARECPAEDGGVLPRAECLARARAMKVRVTP